MHVCQLKGLDFVHVQTVDKYQALFHGMNKACKGQWSSLSFFILFLFSITVAEIAKQMLDRCIVRSDNPKYPQNEYMYLEVNLDYSFVEYHQQMRYLVIQSWFSAFFLYIPALKASLSHCLTLKWITSCIYQLCRPRLKTNFSHPLAIMVR